MKQNNGEIHGEMANGETTRGGQQDKAASRIGFLWQSGRGLSFSLAKSLFGPIGGVKPALSKLLNIW
jgi:hypothetical protein